MALLLAAGCDIARPDPPSPTGPPLHVVAMSPSNGQGTECVGLGEPECGVPPNLTIQLRFDRPLDPSTVVFEAIRLYSFQARNIAYPFDAKYDPVERVVTMMFPLAIGGQLSGAALYQIDLLQAREPGDDGFRAFDGAPLEEGDLPLHVSFFTSETPTVPPAPVSYDCATILSEVFSSAGTGCASSACHKRANAFTAAPMGLWLDSQENLLRTAMGRVAHQTEWGDSAGNAVELSTRFGVQMPLIDAGNAGNSYLLYKLLVSPENFEPCPENSPLTVCAELGDQCATAYPDLPLAPGSCLAPSADELVRLREWMVRGEPMPIRRDAAGGPNPRATYLPSLRALTRFINAGADCAP